MLCDGLHAAVQRNEIAVGTVFDARDVPVSRTAFVDLRSLMHRYGTNAGELDDLLRAIQTSGLTQVGWSVHPLLSGTISDYFAEINEWLSMAPVILQSMTQPYKMPWFVSDIHSATTHRPHFRRHFGSWKAISLRQLRPIGEIASNFTAT